MPENADNAPLTDDGHDVWDWGDDDETPRCDHDWLDRPESDTHVCRACGEENVGPPPGYRIPPASTLGDGA